MYILRTAVLVSFGLLLTAGCSGSQEPTSSAPPSSSSATSRSAASSEAASDVATDISSPLREAPGSASEHPSELTIEKPPSGSLSEEELAAIAEDIRMVQAYPDVKGAAQYMLSFAAGRIENPDADFMTATVSGYRGALSMYRALKRRAGERVKSDIMEDPATSPGGWRINTVATE